MTMEPLTPAEFRKLPEYSCSIPTGTTIGKRWLWNRNSATLAGNRPGLRPDWWIRWYAKDHEDDTKVLIRSRKALAFEIPDDMKEAPEPPAPSSHQGPEPRNRSEEP